MEEYSGPCQPVDLVLMIHSAYHFWDDFDNQIQRCLKWLKPGGSIVMVHDAWNDFFLDLSMALYKILIIKKHMLVPQNINTTKINDVKTVSYSKSVNEHW